MAMKAGYDFGEVPCYFPRPSIKFQGHTAKKIVDSEPNWAFPDQFEFTNGYGIMHN